LGEFIVVKQRSDGVGHDELVGFFAVTYCEGVVFVVFDEPDDLELELLAIRGFNDKDIAQFEQTVFGCVFVVVLAVR
jgi:hypothetical protein